MIAVPGKPLAAFVCPGHPLLESTIDLIIERNRDLLKRGAVLIDESDPGEEVRTLIYLEHAIQDARLVRSGQRRIVSKQMQFVEIDVEGNTLAAGYAPYLNYRPLTEDELAILIPARPIPTRRASEGDRPIPTQIASEGAEFLACASGWYSFALPGRATNLNPACSLTPPSISFPRTWPRSVCGKRPSSTRRGRQSMSG